MSPRISIIMSAWEKSGYLAETIDSLLNQSFVDFELIIIDDGLNRQSVDLIKNYQNKDARISFVENGSNIGLTRSLNKGIGIARGKYIARNDAGDISLPDRLLIQYNFLENNPEVFLCGTNAGYIDDKNNTFDSGFDHSSCDPDRVVKILPWNNCFTHSTIIFRQENIYYRDKFYYSQDYDLYLRLLSDGRKLVNLPDKLVYWRMAANSISFQKYHHQQLFSKQARNFYRQRVERGRDEYNQFEEKMILSLTHNSNGEALLLEELISKKLVSNEWSVAKDLYINNYGKLTNVSWVRKIFVGIVVYLPLLYLFYRKLKSIKKYYFLVNFKRKK